MQPIGTIDVSILTTGQSEGMKKRRFAIKNNLKDLVKRKGKVQTINYQKTWNELKEASDVVSKILYRIYFKKIREIDFTEKILCRDFFREINFTIFF